MTTEPTTPEGQAPATEPNEPVPYTHLTVTLREPLESAQPVESSLTVTLSGEAWPEDVVDLPLSDAPAPPPENVDDSSTSDVTIYRDDMDDIYEAIEAALVEAGRKARFDTFEGGDVFVLAYTDAAGELLMTHTTVSDGVSYLEDNEWVTSWRFHHA